MNIEIRIDPLEDPRVLALLREHLDSMEPTAPPESRHALDLSGLKHRDVTFWSAWDGDRLAGFAALKELDPLHSEVKSMRTASAYLRKGIASHLLSHLIGEARRRAYTRLSLETGSMDFFRPARELYQLFGFRACRPFGDYVEDPNSVFMTLPLEQTSPGVLSPAKDATASDAVGEGAVSGF